MEIVEAGPEALASYGEVPIRFEVRSRLGPDLVEVPVEPWIKNYDALEPPSSLPGRFDVSCWRVFLAKEAGRTIGSAVVAWGSADFDMLEGGSDLAVLVDIRVAEEFRGHGVGRKLFESAAAWARAKGCVELRVETQDINVPACRFYKAMGCRLLKAVPGAYAPDNDETMLLWSIPF